MKKISIFCLVLLLLFCFLPVLAADVAEDTSVIGGCNTLDGQVPFLGTGQLISNAAAAVLYETNTDTLMYAQNADEQVQPASLLKILTALIAIEKGNMDDVVTVRADVLATLAADAAVVELAADEVLTVKDLLYSMMVGSGNDAAVVLADHVMGNQQAFVEEMNRYAAELGCTGTNFTNVHGLHDSNQYTTARDVARILTKAIQNEQFCEVFGEIYYNVPETNKSSIRFLESQNYLMNNDRVAIHYDTRVTGSRTAVNNDQTRSIASVAQVNDMSLVCVVIGAKSQYDKNGNTEVFGGYDETRQLLDLGFTGHKTAQILHPDQVLQQSSVLNGDCDVTMGIRNGAMSVIADNIDTNGLTYRYVDEVGLTAPIEKGQKLSTLQVWNGAVCLAETEVYAMNSVKIAGTVFEDNGSSKGNIGFLTLLLYLVGAAVAIVIFSAIVLFALRVTRIAKVRRQSRRNSRNRRRSR